MTYGALYPLYQTLIDNSKNYGESGIRTQLLRAGVRTTKSHLNHKHVLSRCTLIHKGCDSPWVHVQELSCFRMISRFLDVCKRNRIRVDLRDRMLVLRLWVLWVAPVVDYCLQMYILVVTGGFVNHQERRQFARLRDVL